MKHWYWPWPKLIYFLSLLLSVFSGKSVQSFGMKTKQKKTNKKKPSSTFNVYTYLRSDPGKASCSFSLTLDFSVSFHFGCHNWSLNFRSVGGEMRNGYGEKRHDKKTLFCFFFTWNTDSFRLFIVVLTACLLPILPNHYTCKEDTWSLRSKKGQMFDTYQRTDKIDYNVLGAYNWSLGQRHIIAQESTSGCTHG